MDPIEEKLMLPFQLGWIRELRYRAQDDDTRHLRPKAHVCYINPNKLKFWTMQTLLDYLNNHPDIGLKEENFSFKAKPLGLNDNTKEIICQKIQGQKEPVKMSYRELNGPVTRLRKTITKKKNKLTTKNQKDRAELLLPIRVKRTFTRSTLLLSDSDIETATTSSYVSHPEPTVLQNFVGVYKGLQKVFSYLNVKDLFQVQRVCKTWSDIVQNLPRKSVSISGLKIINWEAFAHYLILNRTVHLNMTGVLDAESIDWKNVIPVLTKTDVGEIVINNCTAAVAEQVVKSCVKLDPSFECDSISLRLRKIIIDDQTEVKSNFTFVQISSVSTQGFIVKGNWASLLGLSYLTHLELRLEKNLRPHQLSEDITLSNLTNTLRLEREENGCNVVIRFNMIEEIPSLKSIEHLQLINFDVEDNFHYMLRKCTHLKSLILNPMSCTVSSNDKILEGILYLKNNLKSIIWALSIQRIRKAKNLLGRQGQRDDQSDIEFVPISERISDLYSSSVDNDYVITKEDDSDEPKRILINFYPLKDVETLLKNKLPNLFVRVLKIDKFRSAATPDLNCSQESDIYNLKYLI